MMRRDNSLRALGRATVAIDKSLRDDINSLASSKGLTAAEYLRIKVAEDKRANPQGVMAYVSPVSTVQGVETKLDKIISTPLMQLFLSVDGIMGRPSEESVVVYVSVLLRALKSCPAWARDKVVSELSKNKQGELHLA